MIASQKIGKSFFGAFIYNLKKMYHADPALRATLLDSNFTSIDSKIIQQELRMIRSLNPNLKRYVYHTSLNFSKDDYLDNNRLLAIAHEYLQESGYTNNQYLIFRHYDADHPHIHLLVNRITFDGLVVSDSNNYKKSEAILRRIELKYNLVKVEPSNIVSKKAATKDELEMVLRTNQPSNKMVLQEIMKGLLRHRSSIQEMIEKGEQAGVHFLFNQASTGRITGITYFYNDFKIKGQALGNGFKWAEVVKKLNYEQIRDSAAISAANSRTKIIYGDTPPTGQRTAVGDGHRSTGFSENFKTDLFEFDTKREGIAGVETKDESGRERPMEANPATGNYDNGSTIDLHNNLGIYGGVQISDDIDDEAIHGRNRNKQKKARTNRR